MASSYGDVLARNIRAARSRSKLGQESVVNRMRALGFDTWHRQTMGKVERGERRVTGEEVLALSFALETSYAALIMPEADDKVVEFPGGQAVSIAVVRHSIRGNRAAEFRWSGDTPVFPPPGEPFASEPGPDMQISTLTARLEAVERQLREERARNGEHQPPGEDDQ